MENLNCNLENFRLPTSASLPPKTTQRIVHVRQSGESFIKGPIPVSWIVAASKLPGANTLPVALVICYVLGMRGQNTVCLERYHFDQFDVKKDSARRALERLQGAGLIEFTKVGQRFRVTILPGKQEDNESAVG